MDNRLAEYAEMFTDPSLSLSHQEKLRAWENELMNHVLEHAGTRLFRPRMGISALEDSLHWIENEGFRHGKESPKAKALFGFYAWKQLSDEAHEKMHIRSMGPSADTIEIHGVDCRVSGALPDDKAVIIHEDAIMMNQNMRDVRPWLVRHSDGVVRIDIHD